MQSSQRLLLLHINNRNLQAPFHRIVAANLLTGAPNLSILPGLPLKPLRSRRHLIPIPPPLIPNMMHPALWTLGAEPSITMPMKIWATLPSVRPLPALQIPPSHKLELNWELKILSVMPMALATEKSLGKISIPRLLSCLIRQK